MKRATALCSTFGLCILTLGFASNGCTGDDPIAAPSQTDDAGAIDTGGHNDTGAVSDGSPLTPDATADAGNAPCDLSKSFGIPTLLANVDSPLDEEAARVSPSGLELYFTRNTVTSNVNHKQIWRSTRDTPQTPWGKAFLFGELSIQPKNPSNNTGEVASRSMTFVGNTTAYLSIWEGTYWHTYRTRRNLVSDPWETPILVNGLGGAASTTDEFPWLSSDGLRMYFMSNRDKAYRIYVGTLTAAGATAASAVAGPIDPGDGTAYAPVTSADELTLYFSAYNARPGATVSTRNIYAATRAKVGLTFDKATFIPELNTDGTFNQPDWVSQDGCEMYFTSNRASSVAGGTDIYSVRKPL